MNQKLSLGLAEPAAEVKRVENFIKDRYTEIGFDTAVIGLSGGIDSALTAVLTGRALSDDGIELVFLPERTTPDRDKRDVEKLESKFNLNVRTIEIDDFVKVFRKEFSNLSDLSEANIKARIRMTILYTIANEKNGVVVGTGNMSEWLLGYFTKHGDGAADIAPILHLFKTEVKQLAEHLDLPETIIEKPPSAGLWDGQTDEEELGGSYEELDSILYCKRELGLSPGETKERLDLDPDLVDHAYSLVNKTEHKRKNPPGLSRR